MDVSVDLTFVIPLRIDFEERRKNLDCLLTYILENTKSQIIVLEADNEQRYFPLKNQRLRYQFVNDTDPVFYRTMYLNSLLKMASTPIVGIWDLDAIVSVDQINKAIMEIKNGAVMCFPFDGRFEYLGAKETNYFRTNIQAVFLYPVSPVKNSVGGAFMVDKVKYIGLGGENENFYGWGLEDIERVKRTEILGFPVNRIEGPLYHLYHPRGINSITDLGKRGHRNVKELITICKMSTSELQSYISTWEWVWNTGGIK